MIHFFVRFREQHTNQGQEKYLMRAVRNYCTYDFAGIASWPESGYIHISQGQEVRRGCHVCITDKACCVEISKICQLKQKQAISSSNPGFLFHFNPVSLIFFLSLLSSYTVSFFASALLLMTTDSNWRTRLKSRVFCLAPPPPHQQSLQQVKLYQLDPDNILRRILEAV